MLPGLQGTPGIAGQIGAAILREGATLAGRVDATEAAHGQLEADRTTPPREVDWSAHITVVNLRTDDFAGRATGLFGDGFRIKPDIRPIQRDPLDGDG
jgi:hypothetical protein